MNNLKYYLIFLFFSLSIDNYCQISRAEAGIWKSQPTESEKKGLDLIGRSIISERESEQNSKMFKFVRAQRGNAGYYLRYDHYHQDLRVDGSGVMIILSDAMMLSRYDRDILTIDAKTDETSWINPAAAALIAATGQTQIINTDISPVEWRKIEAIWRPVYIIKMLTSDYSAISVLVDAETGVKYETDKSGEEPKQKQATSKSKVNQDYMLINQTAQNGGGPCFPNNPGQAELFPNFPSSYVPSITTELACIDVCLESGKLAPNSKIKYNNVSSVNDLPADSEGRFVFNPAIAADRLSYTKAFAWWKAYQLITGQSVDMCTDELEDYKFIIDGGTSASEAEYHAGFIRFGWDHGINPCAMDEFWIAYGLQDLAYKVGTQGMVNTAVNSTIIYKGIKAYKAQVMLGKADESSPYNDICNHYGGLGSNDQFKLISNFVPVGECFTSATIGRNIFTTLFTRMHRNPAIGPAVTGYILDDIFLNKEAMTLQDQKKVILKLFDIARVLFQNGKLSSTQLCAVRAEINNYFSTSSCNINITDNLADYYIADLTSDGGNEPSGLDRMWDSPSIWNRINNDGLSTHQNPEYNNGRPNYLYIKVENRGCESGPSQHDKKLSLYWSMASTGLAWPSVWSDYKVNGVLYGDSISSQLVPDAIAPNTESVLVYEWTPPNPNNILTGNANHISIYARMTDENDKIYDANQTVLEEKADIRFNTNLSNNIAWKNMSIVYIAGKSPKNTTEIKMCPNPVSEQIEISSDSEIVNLQVFDKSGRQVLQQKNILLKTYLFNTSNWLSDLYTVQVQLSNGEVKVLKFIKN